jgi:murein DD-endopeptidase MepM/ murein hydrolase activator NlpD
MVEQKPPVHIWSSWVNARLQGVKTVFQPLLARGLFHLGVLTIVAFSLEWAEIDLPRFSLAVEVTYPDSMPLPQTQSRDLPPVRMHSSGRQAAMKANPGGPKLAPTRVTFVQNLLQSSVPHTIIPDRLRRNVITYTVAEGDTILTIADRFGLRPRTVIWANPELEAVPDLLYIGQELEILPVDGVFHTVNSGETLESIAARYEVAVLAITGCEHNEFESDVYEVAPGQGLVVPGGVKTYELQYIRSFGGSIHQDATRGTGNFVWPVGGYISQGYWELHRAIDIAGAHGDEVVASDSGFVTYAKWDSNGYGNLVVIDHGNGFVTYYAHLYGFYVDAGQSIQRGQVIGARGTTGRSTGAHLHFEIRYDNALRNPLAFLPGQ